MRPPVLRGIVVYGWVDMIVASAGAGIAGVTMLPDGRVRITGWQKVLDTTRDATVETGVPQGFSIPPSTGFVLPNGAAFGCVVQVNAPHAVVDVTAVR